MWFFRAIGNFFWSIFSAIWKWIGRIYSSVIKNVNESKPEDAKEEKIEDLRPSIFSKTVWQEVKENYKWWKMSWEWTMNNEQTMTMIQDNKEENSIDDEEFAYVEPIQENLWIDWNEPKVEEHVFWESDYDWMNEDNDYEEDNEIKEDDWFSNSKEFELINNDDLNFKLEITKNSILVLKNWKKIYEKEWQFDFTNKDIDDVLDSLRKDNIDLEKDEWVIELVERLVAKWQYEDQRNEEAIRKSLWYQDEEENNEDEDYYEEDYDDEDKE